MSFWKKIFISQFSHEKMGNWILSTDDRFNYYIFPFFFYSKFSFDIEITLWYNIVKN